MKAKILDVKGKEKGKIDLPECFSCQIREDIAQKYYEVSKLMKKQPYGPYYLSGKLFSAVGKTRHARNKFRSHYGRGISRVPRKVFWRRGTQFYWEGAGVSGTKGGRRAHPPKPKKARKKINKKEKIKAVRSALTATITKNLIKKRYSSINEVNLDLPLIIESKILNLKANGFYKALEKILNNLNKVVIKKKQKRSGKGKIRNRKNKKTRGLLLVIGSEENARFQKVDVKKAAELDIEDLWPLGRLTIYTEKAVKELNKLFRKENDKNKSNKEGK